MPAQPGDVLRVTASFVATNSSQIQNTFHFVCGNVVEISDALVRAGVGDIIEQIYAPIIGWCSEEVFTDFIDVFIIEGAQALGQQSWPTLIAGSATGDMMPSGTSILTIGRTGVSRRIGKKYWPPGSESNNADGLWAGGYISAALAASVKTYEPLIAANGLILTGVVYDRLLAVSRLVFESVAYGIPAYQRRRKQGVGS